MIRFGIIGTNTITEKFLNAGRQHDRFQITAVYSRTEERAREFASAQGAKHSYHSLESFASSKEIDAVYIASPNSFHAEQAITCMKQGKHVLCEKPMASNQQETAQMIKVAQEEGVVLMEAVKSTLMPGFKTLQDNLSKVGRVRRYFGNYCKYSSRYDAYKEGTVLNAFNPEFSNGSHMDLGIYCVYPMVVLFGAPLSIQANGVKLASGVDGEGSIIASYDGMEAVITHSKINHSYAPSEIQGEKGVMVIPSISEPEDVLIRYNDGTTETLPGRADQDAMFYEIEEFIHLIEQGKQQSKINSFEHSLIAADVLGESRKQMGITFKADDY
ncbi:Gfo/Idh/MocA family protein [Halobacillus sp. K22]|uniref:Gfo/Idh/MocA family protein n=1 Tax=Halobacillus sp. K22 TaxID=3457431 RepID=UPI003FCE801D